MPVIPFEQIGTVAVALMKAFPLFTGIYLCMLLIGIGIFIKNLMKEKNTKIRFKKAVTAFLLVMFLPIYCYFAFLLLYPVFFSV